MLSLNDRSGNTIATQQLFPMLPKASSYAETKNGKLKGVCNVCGNKIEFIDFGADGMERESGFCTRCGSFCRQRQIIKVFRELFEQSETGPLKLSPDFVVYNTESTRAVHDLLSGHPQYICSEYFGPDIPGGPHVGKTRHEDLQRLSLADNSVDVMLSSDVFEHIPRPYDAHREVFRVLRRGGCHIFTVPFLTGSALDVVLASEQDGKVTYHKEKIFHGDPMKPGEGVLVWTLPGLQMLGELAKIGFLPTIYHLHDPEHGIIGQWNFVFVARKP
jgi:SAM-dependent methyltransferase